MLSDKSLLIVSNVVQRIFDERKVPEVLKCAYKLPIPKKGKDPKLMDHHRGITIAPLIGKVLEIVCMEEELESIKNAKLQFGFTKGRNPAMASVIITECQADARHNKTSLYGGCFDARKAFDVVNHYLLKKKLYNEKVKKCLWGVIDDLYVGGEEKIKLNGSFSRPYSVLQGVKQGLISSPNLYKLFVRQLLENIADSGLGVQIGSIYLGTPACADDILLLGSRSSELQSMMCIKGDYAEYHRYRIHAHPDPKISKSTITELNIPKADMPVVYKEPFHIHNTPLPITDQFKHLGLIWKSGQLTPDIDAKITAARQTAYSMLPVGFHGNGGLDPKSSLKIVELYIQPTLLYGLEAAIINSKDMQKLELYYKNLLRQLQSLPKNTASEGIYIMAGQIKLEGYLHLRILSLFGAITRLEKDNPLRLLAIRQLSLPIKTSWFSYVHKIAKYYNIDIYDTLNCPPTKEAWKAFCKEIVFNQQWSELIMASKTKSTLVDFVANPEFRSPFGLWEAVRGRPDLQESSIIKAKLLVGRPGLKGDLWRTRTGEVTTCPLCNYPTEDTTHWLLKCPNLNEYRHKISEFLELWKLEDINPPNSDQELRSAILNGDRYVSEKTGEVCNLKFHAEHAQRITMNLCYKLMRGRDLLINDLIMGKEL